MSHSIRFIVPMLSSLIAASALAQTQPTPAPSSPDPQAQEDVVNLSNVTMQSPNTPGAAAKAAAAPQPPPAAVQPALPPPPPPPMTQPAFVVAPAPAAPEPIHQGFYLRIVNAPTVVSFTGSGPAGDARVTGLGASSIIGIGGSIAPGLMLGAMLGGTEITGKFNGGPFIGSTVTKADGSHQDANNEAAVGASTIGLMLDWFPKPTGGWHVGVGGGLGALMVQNLADSSKMMGTGLTGRMFGGYDFAIGKAWSLGLGLSLSAMTSSKLKDADDTTIDTGYRLKSIGVGFDASILYF